MCVDVNLRRVGAAIRKGGGHILRRQMWRRSSCVWARPVRHIPATGHPPIVVASHVIACIHVVLRRVALSHLVWSVNRSVCYVRGHCERSSRRRCPSEDILKSRIALITGVVRIPRTILRVLSRAKVRHAQRRDGKMFGHVSQRRGGDERDDDFRDQENCLRVMLDVASARHNVFLKTSRRTGREGLRIRKCSPRSR